ncbi:uncharacterized protein LOC143042111 [Mytilus galloprovincialis]|uniref:uncharacterized protein LOC143042111 n=1 Tax=Mytilus galloprovincialis TaxID=29158 RepID=UPI003F7CC3B9
MEKHSEIDAELRIDYDSMCNKIAKELTTEDLKEIKFLLRADIGKATWENIKDGKDLVTVLERREYFTRNEVTKLEKLFIDVKLFTLATVVRQYNDCIPRMLKIDESEGIARNYATHSMTIVQNFVETENYRRMEEIINRKGAVLVKGPPGAGKSQNAFHYANKFRKEHQQSIVWRVHCKSTREMHLSYTNLMLRLGIREVIRYSESDINECIRMMFDRVYKKLTEDEYTQHTHLIIMDDMESPKTAQEVHEMMEYFIIAKNIYVIGTSQHRYSPMLTYKYGTEVSKMTDNEVIELFKLDNNTNDPTDINEIKELAKKMDYLPLCLALAASYIRITKTSIGQYNRNWSELQKQAHEISTEGKKFDASYILTLEKLEKDLPESSKNLLQYIPYLNNNTIPIQLLESLLEYDSSSTETDVNTLLAALHDYSLAAISGKGVTRIIAFHSVTVWFLDKRKSESERQEERLFLLRHFCYYIDNDARLTETMNRNVKFLEHACCLLRSLEKNGGYSCFETKLFECYLCCSVGVTFHLYGNTQVSADYFFKKAKMFLLKLIPYELKIYEGLKERNVDMSSVENFLRGNDEIKSKSNELFRTLTRKAREIPDDMIKKFVLMKYRSCRDIRLLREYGKLSETDIPKNQIPEQCLQKLIDCKVILPLEDVKEIFLAELFATIMYNHSKNMVFIDEAKDENEDSSINSKTHTPEYRVNREALHEYHYALNIAAKLDDYIKEISTNLHSVRYILTKRGGIYYFMRRLKSKEITFEVIETLNEMIKSGSEKLYFDFGVLKMCKNYDLYQRCMIQNILRMSNLVLSEQVPTEKEHYIHQALFHCDKMESILSEMEPWIALTSVHLDIAETYMTVVSPRAEKAKHHFKMAFEKQELPTRYKLKAYKSFVRFCYQKGEVEDFVLAEHFSQKVLRQATQDEQKKFIENSIENLRKEKSKRLSDGLDNKLATCDVSTYSSNEDTETENKDEQKVEELSDKAKSSTDTISSVRDDYVTTPNDDMAMEEKSQERKQILSTLDRLEQNIVAKIEEMHEKLLKVEIERLDVDKRRLEVEKERLELDKEKVRLLSNKGNKT